MGEYCPFFFIVFALLEANAMVSPSFLKLLGELCPLQCPSEDSAGFLHGNITAPLCTAGLLFVVTRIAHSLQLLKPDTVPGLVRVVAFLAGAVGVPILCSAVLLSNARRAF